MSAAANADESHDPYAALRFPVYRYFIFSYILAVIGSQVLSVTLFWKIWDETGDARKLLYVALLQAAPILLLSLAAGQIADRFSRKRVLLITQVVLVLCPVALGVMSLRSHGSGAFTKSMYAIVLVNQIALTFGRPVRNAILPTLVPPSAFGNAITWNSTCFEIASVVGPALAGGVIALAGTPAALFFSGASMFVCFVLTLFLPAKAPVMREPVSLRSLLAGVRFVFRHELLLAAMTLDLFAVLLGGCTALLPIFAKDILHVGAIGFGFLEAAPSAGAICMAMFIAHRPPLKRPGRAMLLAVAGFGAVTIVFGMSRSYPLSLAMMFLLGSCDNISVIVRHTLVQVLTPDAVRGRVTAVNQIFIGSSNELGKAESAIVLKAFGPVISAVSGGIGTILIVGAIAGVTKSLWKLGRLDELKPLDFTPEQADV